MVTGHINMRGWVWRNIDMADCLEFSDLGVRFDLGVDTERGLPHPVYSINTIAKFYFQAPLDTETILSSNGEVFSEVSVNGAILEQWRAGKGSNCMLRSHGLGLALDRTLAE